MKGMLIGFALGAIAGVAALKKMQQSELPEKAIEAAKDKLGCN